MKAILFTVFVVAAAAACTNYSVTATSLNVRSGPGTSYKTVGTKKKGATVCVSSISNNWAKITEGYVSASYIKKASNTASTTTTTTTTTTQYVTATSLNIRSGPGTSYSSAGSYSKCTKVSVVSTSNGWAKLSTGKYVSAQYLSKTNPCSSTTTVSGSCSIPSTRKDSPRPAKVTSKSCNVVYYSQCDTRWKSNKYSTHTSQQTYCNSACGPTSMAMVIATLKDASVLPTTLGAWAVSNGYRTYDNGTAWGFYAAIAKKYGLTCTQTTSTDTVVTALKAGKLVVASMGKGYWTSAGHYICLYDVSGDYIVAHDPYSTSRVKASISSFKSESKAYWIFTK